MRHERMVKVVGAVALLCAAVAHAWAPSPAAAQGFSSSWKRSAAGSQGRRAQRAEGSFGSVRRVDTPRTRMVPIGSPSAVDRYRQSSARAVAASPSSGRTGQDSMVRHASWLQSPGDGDSPVAPALPSDSGMGDSVGPGVGSGMTLPRDLGSSVGPQSPPASPRASPDPPQTSRPQPGRRLPSPGNEDLAPMAAPQLGGGFATVSNCANVSPPSRYTAASGNSCGSPIRYAAPAPQTYVSPPAQTDAPLATPLGATGVYPAAPARSLISFGQELYPVQVGQGLWGQPVAYVPGQRVRNWVRYLFP